MNTPILVASGVSKAFHTSVGLFRKPQQVQAVANVSFTLNHAETLAVVGETGSGKSTLASVLGGLLRPDAGLLLLNDKPVDFSDRRMLLRQIRLIFQNPGKTLNPRATILRTLLQPLLYNSSIAKHQANTRVNDILEKVGLRHDQKYWYPHMFSSGQQQRVAIARALVSEPDIIIADEPLSALDVSVQAQVINLLRKLQTDTGVSYIFISHNLSMVRHFSDKVMVMFGGQMVEYGLTRDIFERAKHPYTRALLASMPGHQSIFASWRPAGRITTLQHTTGHGCIYAGRCPSASTLCLKQVPQQKPVDQQIVSCHRAGEL